MSEFEDIQKLIQLKRYETPGEGFAENFLREFHQRQRAEMLKKSSLELLIERVQTWWGHLAAPKWSLAAVAAAICAGSAWLVVNHKQAEPVVTAVPAIAPVPEKPFIPKMDLSELPMANIATRNDSKLQESLLRKHLEIRPVLEGNVQPLPASANGLQQPSIKNASPARIDEDEPTARKQEAAKAP